MAEPIVANIVVSMPAQLFTLARSFKAAANGKVYIGKIDTDPTIPENQIQVYIQNEDDSLVPIAQPIIINTGGYPVYGGQISKFVTVEGHSMAVYDAYNAQQFYFPNVLKYDPDMLVQRLAGQDGYKYIGRCPDIATLRTIVPTFSGQKIDVISYYLGWAATQIGAIGGGFFDAVNDSTTADDGGSFIRASAIWGWRKSFINEISVYDFGVKADGVTDDTARHQAAQDYANTVNGVIAMHRGTSLISTTVIQKVGTKGQGIDATIIKPTSTSTWGIERNTGDINTSSYKPLWQMGKKPTDTHVPRNYLQLTDIWIMGLAARPIIRSADRNSIGFFADGVHVADDCIIPTFRSVRVERCQNGYNTYNATGHVGWWDCIATDNWNGWWVDYTSGDYRMFNCNFTGNQFASVGIHGEPTEARVVGGRANFSGIFGWSASGCHFGFGPYGVYQKTGTVGSIGMVDCKFYATNIEAIGNTGIRLSEHPATSSNGVDYKGAFSWTAPLGSGSAAAYQIQGDANHPIQITMINFKHLITGVAFNLDGTTIPVGNSGLKAELGTLQTQVFMASAFQFCSVGSGGQRLVDSNLRPYTAITTIANGVAITTNPQTLTTLAIPPSLQKAPRMMVETSIPFRATAAANGVQIRVNNQSAANLGLVSFDVPNGNSSIGVIIDFIPAGATSVTLDIITASTGLSVGAGTATRVKWSAGFAYAT